MWEWVDDLVSDAPQRDPGFLLTQIEWLPDDGAFAASVQDANPGSGREPEGPHRFYRRGIAWHLLADLWDLQAAAANGSKKKPPTYPRPGRRQKPRGTSLFAMARARKG